MDIDHDYTSDLRISLISPQGTEVVLANRRGGDGNDYTGTLFDDEATKTIAQGVAPFTGSFRPETALSTLDGVSAAGLWTLVIQDAQALNSGFLLDWSLDFTLDNDIFGAFESNDTIATATDLAGIDGTGTASVSASIGDGGFGVLDRDLFRIDVGAGTTLQAAATSGGSLDAALRLFDEAGQELKRVNPAGTLDATITNFVFPEGGTFYLAVSESANVAYDPFDVTSGVAAQSTGSYTLGVAVIPGVSDPALVLSGEVSSFGTGSDGSFGAGAGASRTGLSLGGQEFLFDADNANAPILHFFGASVAGFTFRNDGAGGDSGIPVSLTDQSDAFNRRVVGESIFRGLRVQRSVSQGIQDASWWWT
ncbi:MAG: proprotein convertase P-domain-containing protein [Phycisphaeraceae bacterium]|nr:proprotein convertase P-domain-containing protein [Phycisphaeraceae bacterium]